MPIVKRPTRARSKLDALHAALAAMKAAAKQLDIAIDAVAKAVKATGVQSTSDVAKPSHGRRALAAIEKRDWMTTDEVADQVLVSRGCVVGWARAGRVVERNGFPVRVRLSALPVGGRLRITKRDLQAFLEAIRIGGESMLTESPAEFRRRAEEAQKRAEEALRS